MYSYYCRACGARTDSVHMQFTKIIRTGEAENNCKTQYVWIRSYMLELLWLPTTHRTATFICFIFIFVFIWSVSLFASNFDFEFGSISLKFHGKTLLIENSENESRLNEILHVDQIRIQLAEKIYFFARISSVSLLHCRFVSFASRQHNKYSSSEKKNGKTRT